MIIITYENIDFKMINEYSALKTDDGCLDILVDTNIDIHLTDENPVFVEMEEEEIHVGRFKELPDDVNVGVERFVDIERLAYDDISD